MMAYGSICLYVYPLHECLRYKIIQFTFIDTTGYTAVVVQ